MVRPHKRSFKIFRSSWWLQVFSWTVFSVAIPISPNKNMDNSLTSFAQDPRFALVDICCDVDMQSSPATKWEPGFYSSKEVADPAMLDLSGGFSWGGCRGCLAKSWVLREMDHNIDHMDLQVCWQRISKIVVSVGRPILFMCKTPWYHLQLHLERQEICGKRWRGKNRTQPRFPQQLKNIS